MATATGSISQPVKDGKLVDTNANAAEEASRKSKNSLDKEAFLQLLVAQMKYQDPLEPTSNTEYISQLATFSSLEEMQNLNATMTDAQAASLVGKQVIMRTTSTITGTTTYASGKVDLVLRENGKTYLQIENQYYNIEDLDSIIDEEYLDAATLAGTFETMMQALPSKNMLTLGDKTKLELARKAYDSMNDYQKGMVDPQYVDKLKELEAKLKELQAGSEDGGDDGDDGTTDGTGGTDGSGDAGGTGGTDGSGGSSGTGGDGKGK